MTGTSPAYYCQGRDVVVIAWQCPNERTWHVRWFPENSGDYISATDEDRACAPFDTADDAIDAAFDYIEQAAMNRPADNGT